MKSPPGIWETHYQRSYVPFSPHEPVNLSSIPAGLSSTVSAEYRAKSEERRLRRPVARMSLEPRSRSEGPSRPIFNRTKGKRTLNTMNTYYDDPTAAGRVNRKISSIHPVVLTDYNQVKQSSDQCDSASSQQPSVAVENTPPAQQQQQCCDDTVDNAAMSQSNSSNGSNDSTVTVTDQVIETHATRLVKSCDDKSINENISPVDDNVHLSGDVDVSTSNDILNTTTCIKLRRKTEYKSKFRPFSAYVYLPGDGFIKRKNLCNGDFDRAKEWYHEVTDRSLKAFELQKASQSGHPIVGDGRLDEIYSKDVLAGPWAHARDRSLDALSLATVQLRIQEKRRERQDEQLRKQKSQSLTARTASPGKLVP